MVTQTKQIVNNPAAADEKGAETIKRFYSSPKDNESQRANIELAAEEAIERANRIMRITARSAKEIVSSMKPKAFILEDILAKENLYSLTAPNNHGKTTAACLMVKAITSGTNFGNHRTIKGRVLLLSGENTNDTMLKLIALDVDLGQLDVIDSPFDLKATIDEVVKHNRNEYVGVFVDSTQSYFGEGEMNGNADQLAHWQSLRRLTKLNGDPFVLSLSHPVKNAPEDNLVPFGGGSAINEIDTNLTLWKKGDIATLRVAKTRQGQFEPIKMKLEVHHFTDRKNNFGKPETTSKFRVIEQEEAEVETYREATLEQQILKEFDLRPETTNQHLGTKYFLKDGESMLDQKAAERARKRAAGYRDDLEKRQLITKLGKVTKKGKELL